MQYYNHVGALRNSDNNRSREKELVASVKELYMRNDTKRRLKPLREKLGIKCLTTYLRNAIKFHRCVIVLKDPYTLSISCCKAHYTVDYETLRILDVVERSGGYL